MRQASIDKSRRTEKPSDDNRRGTERVPAQFSLMYSGMSEGRMLIGNGVVSNVSKSGIGILGNQLGQTRNGSVPFYRPPWHRGADLHRRNPSLVGVGTAFRSRNDFAQIGSAE